MALSFRSLCLILFVVFLLWPANSRADGVSDIPDLSDRAALLKADPRLARTVTFVQREACVGELLDVVTQQTGIAFSAEERDGSDAERITVCVRDLPTVDLMTSLWSLLSYRTGTWLWLRQQNTADKQKPVAYHFAKTPAARELSYHTRAVIETYFERMFEAKRLAASSHPPTGLNKNEEFPEVAAMDDRTRSKEAAFFSQFSPTESLNLARGAATDDNPRLLPRSQWTPETIAYVDAEMALRYGPDPDHKHPQPQQISIHKDRASNDEVTPTLWFVMDTIGGPSVAGSVHTERWWKERLAPDWMLPGDTTDDSEKGSLAVAAPPKSALQSEVVDDGRLIIPPTSWRPAVDQVIALYERSGIPLLARLSGSQRTVRPLLQATTVGARVAALRKEGGVWNRSLWLKWRNGVLLVTYPAWIVAADAVEETYAPWQAIKAFRAQVAADPDDAPSFAALCALAARLTVAQLSALDKRLDLVGRDDTIGRWLGENRVLIAELDRLPALREQAESENGVLVRHLPRAAREYIQSVLGVALTGGTSLRVRTAGYTVDEKAFGVSPSVTRGRNWRLQLFDAVHPETILKESAERWYPHHRRKPASPPGSTDKIIHGGEVSGG